MTFKHLGFINLRSLSQSSTTTMQTMIENDLLIKRHNNDRSDHHSPYGWKSKWGHHSNHHTKSNSTLNAVTLLAFLFFLNLLQNCLRDNLNPTDNGTPIVVVMTTRNTTNTSTTVRVKRETKQYSSELHLTNDNNNNNNYQNMYPQQIIHNQQQTVQNNQHSNDNARNLKTNTDHRNKTVHAYYVGTMQGLNFNKRIATQEELIQMINSNSNSYWSNIHQISNNNKNNNRNNEFIKKLVNQETNIQRQREEQQRTTERSNNKKGYIKITNNYSNVLGNTNKNKSNNNNNNNNSENKGLLDIFSGNKDKDKLYGSNYNSDYDYTDSNNYDYNHHNHDYHHHNNHNQHNKDKVPLFNTLMWKAMETFKPSLRESAEDTICCKLIACESSRLSKKLGGSVKYFINNYVNKGLEWVCKVEDKTIRKAMQIGKQGKSCAQSIEECESKNFLTDFALFMDYLIV